MNMEPGDRLPEGPMAVATGRNEIYRIHHEDRDSGKALVFVEREPARGYTAERVSSDAFRETTMRMKGLCLALFLIAACDRAPDAPSQIADAKSANAALGARWQYPREREYEGRRVIVHAPQIRSWDNFEHFTAQVAVEFLENNAAARYGVIDLSGDTTIDMKTRIVSVPHPKVDRVTFTGAATEEQTARVRTAVEREPLEVPVDVFLYYLADNVLETPAPSGFNTEPPPIHVVETPTFLLFFNGEPVRAPIGRTGLELVINANFPTVYDTAGKRYYLMTGDRRYLATQPEGPWTPTTELPASFSRVPAKGEYASIASLAATEPAAGLAPRVITTTKPAEIVVLDGKAQFEEIPDTGGLAYATNTESPLFRLGDKYYLLIAGRWFSTKYLLTGPWKFTMPLPEAFARIPADHAMASARASVPGTLEARRAVLEASLPTRKAVAAGAAPKLQVSYAGEPRFEPIAETEVARAVNTGNDILKVGEKFYLCYEGVWYVGDSASGPWAATASVPGEIYEIPPSSPSYPVTQVIAQPQPGTTTIVYEYPPSYDSGVYVAFGIGYYGTGWYYPPYYYGGYYYPYYGTSYGHGSWYNPNTGGYGSRSVWYGPYGGYTYNQGYNPNTGRYSNVETAWDGDEWVSAGETYNPRTGISTETDRHYGEDSNKMKMDRTVEGPGGNEMKVERNTDFDTGTSTTTRKTSQGGKSEVTRQRQAGGGTTTSGTIETAGGKTATIEGEHRGGEGTTAITGEGGGSATIDRERTESGNVKREGSFTGQGGQSVDTETVRDGRSTVTKAEGSGGGQAISASGGLGDRTTIAQSGSGDLYAGHDGEVYRKTDDGWQHHTGEGGWESVDTPERPGDGERPGAGERQTAADGGFSREQFDAASRDVARDSGGGQRYGGSGSLQSPSRSGISDAGASGGTPSRPSYSNTQQLNRDAAARSGGYQSYERRTAPRSSGMSRGARPRRR
jgi:hypothetical protein